MGTLYNVDGTTGQITVENGTVSAPALAFISDTGTGLYRIGSQHLGLATNGVLQMDWTTSFVTSALPLNITASSAGTTLAETISNTSNTASSNAQLQLKTAGSSSGNPYVLFQVFGVSQWSLGVDNSASQVFKLSNSGGIGSSDKLIVSAAGNLTLTATSNQITLGTTNTTTISSTAPSAARTYTIPDAGASTANIVLDKSNYTIGGTWTFSTAPTLSTALSVSSGGTGDASLTAYALLAGGTTSTGALQQVSGTGSSGQVLTSNGASVLPTWQNVTGTGTVNSGTQFQLAYYATSTNAVSGNATIYTDANGDLFVPNGNDSALSIQIGADAGSGSNVHTITNNTTKRGQFGIPHYTSATQAAFAALVLLSTSTTNEVQIGGGSTTLTAANKISLITASTNTNTSGGTTALTINSSQQSTFSGDVTISETGNANFTLNSGAATSPVILQQQNSVTKSRIGIANGANSLCTGSVAGDLIIRGESQKILFSPDSGTTAAIIIDTTSHSQFSNGSAANPAITFINSTATGMYRAGSDIIGFSTNGTVASSIDASQRVIVGQGTARVINGTNNALQIEGTATADSRASITLNINSAAGAQLLIARSRGTTTGSSTILQNNDFIGGFSFMGANGVDMSSQGAYIFASINGTPSSTSMPTRLEFATTPVGSVGSSVGLTINAAQQVLIGDGTATVPSLGFVNATGTGFYRGGNDLLVTAVGITWAFGATSSGFPGFLRSQGTWGVQSGFGTAAAPSFSFTGDEDTGLYGDGTNTIRFTTNGVQRFKVDTTTLQVIQSGFQIQADAGTAAAPGYTIAGNANTGMYSGGTNLVAFSSNGSQSCTIGSYVSGTLSGFAAPDGSASVPGFAFSNQVNTGLYRSATNTMNFTTNGTSRMSIDTTNISAVLNLIPSTDNTRDLGGSGNRWANIWGTTIHSGDVQMENNWRITEGEKVGHPEEGIMFLSPTGKKYKISMTEVD